MKIEGLQRALSSRPFRPFSVRTADGRDFPVAHPEAVAWEIDSSKLST